jgi:hypothetical protein
LAAVSAGNVCRLECCAARSPHAAGSCMNGSCHAAIKIHQSKLQRSLAPAPAEEFCGLKRLSKTFAVRATSTEAPTTPKSLTTLGRPCDADCASGAVGSVSAKGQLGISPAYQQQPLWTRRSIDSDRISLVEAFPRQYSPRGPPTKPSLSS